MNKAIELIKKAREKQDLDVVFDLEVYGETIPILLSTIDYYDIIEAQDIEYKAAFARYRKKGLDEEPIDEVAWETGLKAYNKETQEILKKEKPQNMAQEAAQKFSKMKTIFDIIPKYMKDPKTKLALFPTKEDQEYIKELLSSDAKFMGLISEKFGELLSKSQEQKDTVKNSSKQES